jgi:pilus assembly protein CpaB
MGNKGVLVPALLAMASAIVYMVTLTSKEKALSNAYESGQVLVARADIPERTVLKEDMVETLTVPRKFMQQDAFEVRTPSDLKMISNLVSRVRIPKGNQIGESMLVSMSPDAGLSVKIPPGYRGAVLPIDPGMKSLIKPGDRVDILLTFEAVMEGSRHERVTITILQNILVVAVGSNMGQGATAGQLKSQTDKDDKLLAMSDKALLSLALNPNELEYLALAQRQGDIAIGVRGLGDYEMHTMPLASLSHLMGTDTQPR